MLCNKGLNEVSRLFLQSAQLTQDRQHFCPGGEIEKKMHKTARKDRVTDAASQSLFPVSKKLPRNAFPGHRPGKTRSAAGHVLHGPSASKAAGLTAYAGSLQISAAKGNMACQ